MKIFIAAFSAFLFISCSGSSPPPPNNNAAFKDPAKIEKNKQIALLNEVTKATQTAQRLEKQGRDMEAIRVWSDAESRRQCGALMDARQRETKDLADKIKSFPPPFGASLDAFAADLDKCVSCSKTALASCVKARASINKSIEEIYSQPR